MESKTVKCCESETLNVGKLAMKYMRFCTNSLLKSLLKTKDDWNVSELEEQLYGLLSQLQKAGAKQVVEPNREKVEEILSNEVKVPSDRTVYY